MTSCIIQHQLSVAAAAAMASLPSFPLRPASNTNPTLFQSQPLRQALLHPGPGPICSTHTQVLFSPYWPWQSSSQLWTTAHSRPETCPRWGTRQCLLYSVTADTVGIVSKAGLDGGSVKQQMKCKIFHCVCCPTVSFLQHNRCHLSVWQSRKSLLKMDCFIQLGVRKMLQVDLPWCL